MSRRCRYGLCGKKGEAAHSPGCKSHPRIHRSIVDQALLKKREPAFCCAAHRKRQLENEYRARRREREDAAQRNDAKAPIARRVAAAVAESIDPDLVAWRRTS